MTPLLKDFNVLSMCAGVTALGAFILSIAYNKTARRYRMKRYQEREESLNEGKDGLQKVQRASNLTATEWQWRSVFSSNLVYSFLVVLFGFRFLKVLPVHANFVLSTLGSSTCVALLSYLR